MRELKVAKIVKFLIMHFTKRMTLRWMLRRRRVTVKMIKMMTRKKMLVLDYVQRREVHERKQCLPLDSVLSASGSMPT